jgi:type VI secretion system secreted protein Hcp
MAFEAYGKVKGKTQGDFKSETPRGPHEGKFAILRFEWGVSSPKDVKTGQSSGRRTHAPFVFAKEIGAATPQFFQALTKNEQIEEAMFEFTRTTPEGEEEIYFTVKLTDAQVAAIKYSTGGDKLGGDSSARGGGQYDLMEQEEIQLTYRRVEVTHVPGSTSAIDDWNM